VVLNSGGNKKKKKKKEKYLNWWPPSFMPAAKGSARTPLGPITSKHAVTELNTNSNNTETFSIHIQSVK
jgi:hypothetical protein